MLFVIGELIHNSCNMCINDLPNMYCPQASGIYTYGRLQKRERIVITLRLYYNFL